MLNPKLKLSEKIFDKKIDMVPTRNGYGEGVVDAGEKNPNIVVLCADLTDSTRSVLFRDKFPERFIEIGVAEQALATIGAGLALGGKIPFISSYAAFSPGRNWEQIATTSAINDLPVKVIGAHAGVSVGPDGATHQMCEDIALMRVMPNMIVVVPGDYEQTKKATIEIAKNGKPSYLRMAREKTPVFTTSSTPFEIGKAQVLWESKDPQVALIGCGPLVYEALLAARELSKSKIECLVINSHTIKPLDEQTIIRAAKSAGCIVTIEEHQVIGGLGGAVAETLARNFPVPMEFIGMQNTFGQSGDPDELLSHYRMRSKDIVEAAKRVIARKNN